MIDGSDEVNTSWECVEKNKARNVKQVRWSVDVEVVGDCESTPLDVEMINGTWVANDPGRTDKSECRRLNPACRMDGEVFDDFSWFKRAFDKAGTCALRRP